MNKPARDQTSLRSSPFQSRALYFFKKFTPPTRAGGKKSRDGVTIPTQDFQRAHSSVDLFRKPDISPLIGFRVEVGTNPMDTDDSSQDASTSGSSPGVQSRRHSTLDSLRTSPLHPTFAGRGPACLFCRDQLVLGNEFLVHDSGNVLAPAPLFLRSNLSVGVLSQVSRSPISNPDISQITAASEPKPHEEVVQNTLDDGTPRPLEDILSHDATFTTPLTDPASSTSSDPNPSRPQSAPMPEDFIPQTIPKRPALLPRHSAPLPPPFRLATERGLRLSPSIVARQPMPILSLPALPPPPPPPPAEETPPRQKVPLRSMPSLSRHGRSNAGCLADHENATLGDSDEDDGDCDEIEEEEEPADALSVHQSDDEDEDLPSASSSGVQDLKNLQQQPMKDGALAVEGATSVILSPRVVSSSNLADYFCSETYTSPIQIMPTSTSLDMYPFSPNIPDIGDIDRRHLGGGARLEHKPSLYRAASRSMINLGSTRRVEQPHHLKSRETARSSASSVSGQAAETPAESEESDTEAMIGRLLRRTSMPSFHPTSEPPPYPTFDPRPKEEGREWLPPYSNTLYLIAIMPRKMEFSSPGVQAKDRKWRRVVCELEGTTLRVYKCPPGASGGGVLGDWWEKRVGVGDVASPNPPRIRKREELIEQTKLGVEESATSTTSGRSMSVPPRQRTESESSHETQSTMTSTPRRAKRRSGASLLSPFRNASSARPETSGGEGSRQGELELLPVDTRDSRSSMSHESTGRASPVARRLSQPSQPRSASRLTFLPVATGRGQWRQGGILKPPASDLLRAYTLQHGESGLGNDYLKRKNVIRVRLEGEQFLLQAPDVPAVVEWIEGLHAGTNIALDLDQRLMPRGPMFPRRRRRRRRVEGG